MNLNVKFKENSPPNSILIAYGNKQIQLRTGEEVHVPVEEGDVLEFMFQDDVQLVPIEKMNEGGVLYVSLQDLDLEYSWSIKSALTGFGQTMIVSDSQVKILNRKKVWLHPNYGIVNGIIALIVGCYILYYTIFNWNFEGVTVGLKLLSICFGLVTIFSSIGLIRKKSYKKHFYSTNVYSTFMLIIVELLIQNEQGLGAILVFSSAIYVFGLFAQKDTSSKLTEQQLS
jgi:hypothetical protein